MRRKVAIVIIGLFFTTNFFSSEDSLKSRFGFYGGLIYSKAYPKNLYKSEAGKIHSVSFSGKNNSDYYLPGYFIGASYSKKTNKNFINLLIDVSLSGLEYEVRESMQGPYPQSTLITRIKRNSYELNYQVQWERNIFKSLYVSNSFLFHQVIRRIWHKEQNSSVTSFQNNVYYTTDSHSVSNYNSGFEIFSGISYRLGLSYKLFQDKCSLNAFRNFGIPARPWWGVGIGYYPRSRK